MKLSRTFVNKLCHRFIFQLAWQRPPDFVVGGEVDPYLRRWYVIPRNPIFNIYVHHFLRSDDDRALHDHPWPSVSILLHGNYWEITTYKTIGFQHDCYTKGDVIMRWSGKYAHRITVNKPCWTLFITGPRYRNWGFLCPQGWVPWQVFTKHGKSGEIGRGCD